MRNSVIVGSDSNIIDSSQTQRFDNWVAEQDSAWLSQIEECPDELMPGPDGNPPHCNNGLWSETTFAATHPNAAYCIRSAKPASNGAGQQVTVTFGKDMMRKDRSSTFDQ